MAADKRAPASAPEPVTDARIVLTCAIDDIALAALRERAKDAVRCSLCDGAIEGDPATTGLFVWTRGDDEVRYEEPPLCSSCAGSLGVTAYQRWSSYDDYEEE
jgi:hypothetical protein